MMESKQSCKAHSLHLGSRQDPLEVSTMGKLISMDVSSNVSGMMLKIFPTL